MVSKSDKPTKLIDFTKQKSKRNNVKSLNWEHAQSIDNYDYIRYFSEKNDCFPNNTYFTSDKKVGYFNFYKLRDYIVENGGDVLFIMNDADIGPRKALFEFDNKMFVVEGFIYKSKDSISGLSEKDNEYLNKRKMLPICTNVTVLHPEFQLEKDFIDKINSFRNKIIQPPTVSLICRDNGGYFVSDIDLKVDMGKDLNLHYGKNFDVFHNKLSDNLLNTNKGITMLHGEPGTGKTSYIRRLIKDIYSKTDKKILFIPNNLVECLVDPDFNSFLLEISENDTYMDENAEIDESISSSKKNNGLILILEDAESVLTEGFNGNRSNGTSNILNLTDGILNDAFGIQIILTFNTEEKKIDEAILRKQRLVAKREFNKLTKEESQNLVDYLNIDHKVEKSMSLADIYSLNQTEEDDILIDNSKKKSKPVGLSLN